MDSRLVVAKQMLSLIVEIVLIPQLNTTEQRSIHMLSYIQCNVETFTDTNKYYQFLTSSFYVPLITVLSVLENAALSASRKCLEILFRTARHICFMCRFSVYVGEQVNHGENRKAQATEIYDGLA